MYTLDFETIRQVMQAHQKTGSLHAKLLGGSISLREPCYVEINITAGAIVSCMIVGNNGRRVTGEKAAQELFRLGQLNWIFTPQQKVVTQPAQPSLTSSDFFSFPRRLAHLEQRQMSSLSRLHRAVFALTDGTKSTAKIAELLSTSPNLVDKALNDMQAMGIIAMNQQDNKQHP